MQLNLHNPLDQCQLKFASDEKTGEFEGYASVFNSNDAVNDSIVPGAFAKSILSGRIPRLFVNHKHGDIPPGSWTDLKEDDHGLWGRGSINLDIEKGRELHSAMQRGDMDGLSIGFTMGDGDFSRKDAGGRIIKNVDLREISVVTFPCEPGARISAVKAEIEGFMTLKDYENYLREVGGFSKSMATAIVSQIAKVARSDSGANERQMTGKAGAGVLAMIENMKTKL